MEDMLDDSVELESRVLEEIKEEPKKSKTKQKSVDKTTEETIINPLVNKKITVKFIPKLGKITNPKHVLFGGMAEDAVKTFTVPRLTSGVLVNVLTNSEKAYLEEVMGLEYNALSIYKKVDNYWENYYVRLTKQDTYLNLSIPEDYIKYKVLLANKDLIAPSLQAKEDFPKETYMFVLVDEGEEIKYANKNMSATMQCYMEFGKIQDNAMILRTIIEIIEGKPTAKNTKIEFLQEKVNKLIQADSKTFLSVVKDPLLPTKALIKKAIEKGIISNRGGQLYMKSDNSPLCEDGEPTLNVAARYLNSPKRQELKFSIEAKIKE